MTLPSRHRIRNSNPGGLRPSSPLLGHGASPQYWIFTSEQGRNTFVSLKREYQSTVRARDLRISKQAALATAPEPLHYVMYRIIELSLIVRSSWKCCKNDIEFENVIYVSLKITMFSYECWKPSTIVAQYYAILSLNFNNNWMTTAVGWSCHDTGSHSFIGRG